MKRTSLPSLGLAERDRRWRLAQQLIGDWYLDGLLVYGDRGDGTGKPFVGADTWLTNDPPGAVVVLPRDDEPRVLLGLHIAVGSHMDARTRETTCGSVRITFTRRDPDRKVGTPAATGDSRDARGARPRYMVDLAARAASLTFLERAVNGEPGLVGQQDGVTVTVFAFDVTRDRITRIWAVRSPDKLRPWTTG
jgi:hypothetical protein